MQTLNEFNNFHKAINCLQELPPIAQNEAFDFIEFLKHKYGKTMMAKTSYQQEASKETTQKTKKKRKAGSLAGQIVLADDFDEPLADFKEYM